MNHVNPEQSCKSCERVTRICELASGRYLILQPRSILTVSEPQYMFPPACVEVTDPLFTFSVYATPPLPVHVERLKVPPCGTL